MEKKVLVLRHVRHEHLGTLAPALRAAGLRYEYLDAPRPDAVFPPPSQLDALVVMGGPMGVYERSRHPFLTKELAFLRRYLKTGKPALGICLGAQLLAKALGARVYPNAAKEIGWYPLELTAAGAKDSLFSSWPRQSTVFQWHGDTFDLPRGATHLARSPLCRRQAFRHGRNVYGLQFHLEVDGPMVRDWLRQPGARAEVEAAAGPGAHAALRRDAPRRAAGLPALAKPFFRGTVRLFKAAKSQRTK